jgi:hypothetical protein
MRAWVFNRSLLLGGQKCQKRRIMMHFHNAGIHNTKQVPEHLTHLGFKRMEHPPDSHDLALCDFFSFSAMKDHFSRQRFDSVDKLFLAIGAFLRGLSADFLYTIIDML